MSANPQNPSTFLDLVVRLRQECRVSGSGPTSVSTATGIEADLVNWISEAWRGIQAMRPDWHFQRRSTTWLTKSGQGVYTPAECGAASGVTRWVRKTFRNFQTSLGQSSSMFMSEMSYDQWRDVHLFGANQDVRTRPTQWAVNPLDHGICVGPLPNADYTIMADFYSKPVIMTADTDVPAIPREYITLIVYKAMMDYGESEVSPEVLGRGAKRYKEMLADMEAEYLNETESAGCLA